MSKAAKATQVVTGEGRLFYVHAFEAKENDQGVKKFSAQYLFKKSDKATVDAIAAAINAAKEEFKAKFPGLMLKNGQFPTGFRLPVRDGDEELAQEVKTDPDYKGHYFINASSKNKPGIVDTQGQEILSQAEIYSGMFGRVILNFYPYDAKGNRGIAAGLNGIQKVRDGEPKSGAGSVSDVFGKFESSEPADAPGW